MSNLSPAPVAERCVGEPRLLAPRVARTTDEIVAAREDWEAGRRFGEVAAYDGPRLSAPPFVARPVPRS
jgi:hypothetical protein